MTRGKFMYDSLPPEDAVRKAWVYPGISPKTHKEAQERLRKDMPLLARALDRLVDSPENI